MKPRTNRRTVIKGIGGTIVGIGGAITTAAEETTPASDDVDTTFHAGDAECTSRTDHEATVSCWGQTVRAEGTIVVPDPCHDAVLRTAEYSREREDLRVVVGAAPTGEVCVQCLAAIDYEVTVTVEDGAPGTVSVHHGDGAEQTTVAEHRCTPPTDLDGDGTYEDINGNGRLDFDDVVTLFENVDSDAVQRNAGTFDFNGNGRIDFGDVVTLFRETLS